MRYADYFELSEKNGWRTTDLDWDELAREQAQGLISDFDRLALVGTAVIEYGAPHYAEVWSLVADLHEDWELWQFTTLWTGEEHRHSYALAKACAVLGLDDRAAADLAIVTHSHFAADQKRSCPTDCYSNIPGMLTYAMIQELATHKFYTLAAKQTASPFLRRLWQLIAGDEMRHHVFFKERLAAGHATAADPVWYIDQVYAATRSFKMPHQVYDLQHTVFGADLGITGSMIAQLARCFAFDPALLMRLASDHTAAAQG